MKRVFELCVMILAFFLIPSSNVSAQDPITLIIKEAVIKAIKAVDLKIQKLQNKTIWLQNAQKKLENKMQELKLKEISGWVEKQRKLYADYYEELWKVKSTFVYYTRVKDIIQKQLQLVKEYKKASALFKQDRHFSLDEIQYIEKVFSGIIIESIKSLDQLYLVITSFNTQMSDAKRLEIINMSGKTIDQNLTDLRKFNNQNIRLSLQRAKDKFEIDVVKALYDIK